MKTLILCILFVSLSAMAAENMVTQPAAVAVPPTSMKLKAYQPAIKRPAAKHGRSPMLKQRKAVTK